MEPIWKGDICEAGKAMELLCIVDQIHEYAVTTQKEFVVQHLEPWLLQAEKDLESVCDSNDRLPMILNLRYLGSKA